MAKPRPAMKGQNTVQGIAVTTSTLPVKKPALPKGGKGKR